MLLIAAIIVFILLLLAFYEFRLRKPDQIVLAESKGAINERRSRFYPRHFSLALPRTIFSFLLESNAEVKGKLLVQVKLAVSVAAGSEHLMELIRVGGWKKDAVATAANELKVLLHARVKEYCEKYEIEELSSERFSEYLNKTLGKSIPSLGLAIVNLSVQAIDPLDNEISEALQQREAARIKEQTEEAHQQARLAAVKARIKTDAQVVEAEHRLALQKYDLKKIELQREAGLDHERLEKELERRRMQLEVERQEIELLKNNPELLVLSPQITRLAEASQNLKNARTVISLSPNEVNQGSQILGMVQNLLQNMLQKNQPDGNEDKKKQS